MVEESHPVLTKLRLASSAEDVKDPRMWRGALAEFVGTMLFVFVGCGSTVGATVPQAIPYIGFCFGLGIATMVWVFADASGGHINPAVSFSMLITRKISLARAVAYMIMQCLGAIAGAAMMQASLTSAPANFCVNSVTVSLGQGVAIELVATSILILAIYATCDNFRTDTTGSGPLAIGLAVALCHFAFIPLTGSSLNPARSLGPAVITKDVSQLWVYWVGPISGGIIAGLLYDLLFASDASPKKIRSYFCDSVYPQPSSQEMKINGEMNDVHTSNSNLEA